MTRVAAVQFDPVVGDLAGNLDRAVEVVARSVAEGDRLIVLPELATSGYVFDSAEEAQSLAIAADDPAFERLRAAAGPATVVIGFAERGEGGALHNSAALLDASGVRAVYRKVHLWHREKLFFEPGAERPPVVETPFGRVGVMICFDLQFPEWTRIAALDGADLLAVPTAWPLPAVRTGEQPSEVYIAVATARLNVMAVVCADRTGLERGTDWIGGTLIVDEEGLLLARAGAGAGTALADVDLLKSRRRREGDLSDLLGDRRPDLYGPLTEAR